MTKSRWCGQDFCTPCLLCWSEDSVSHADTLSFDQRAGSTVEKCSFIGVLQPGYLSDCRIWQVQIDFPLNSSFQVSLCTTLIVSLEYMVESFTSVTANTYIISVDRGKLCGNSLNETVMIWTEQRIWRQKLFVCFPPAFILFSSLSVAFTWLTKGFLQIQRHLQGVCKKMSKYHLRQEVCRSCRCRHSVSARDSTVAPPLTCPFFISLQKQETVPLTVSK